MRSPGLCETRRKILDMLKRLAKEIDATIFLFGSYARGDHMLESDVDIIVVSEKFKGMDYIERIAFVRSRLPGAIGFDIIALTPEELSERLERSSFFKELSRYWVKIVPQEQ